MNISDLIKKLESVREARGNLPVFIASNGSEYSISELIPTSAGQNAIYPGSIQVRTLLRKTGLSLKAIVLSSDLRMTN